jgi:hypothetical protein
MFPGLDSTHTMLLLATLTFETLGDGSLTLGIIADLNEGLVYFLMGNVDITARRGVTILPAAPQVIPEPAAFTPLPRASSLCSSPAGAAGARPGELPQHCQWTERVEHDMDITPSRTVL